MSLFQQACLTYDAMFPVAKPGDAFPLAPISHTVKQPDIEITIDKDGKFQSARLRQVKSDTQKDGTVLKAEPMTIMPVTEQSLNRTNGADANPHYLSENLRYLHAGNAVAYESYVSQLADWAAYANHPKLDAVLQYVKSGTILQDLDGCGVKYTDKSLVCWVVNGLGIVGSGPCWLDKSLMDSLVTYHAVRMRDTHCKEGLCMVTGEHTVLASFHQKGIVRSHGNAKLVSSNSGTNNAYTYKGRFLDAEQALTIGYEASQKAHNALAWLIFNQGVHIGKKDDIRTFLCWNPNGKEIPAVTGFMARGRQTGKCPATPSDYHQQLRDSLLGWKLDLPEDAKAVFLILDAPTTGCLSVLYYNEMSCTEYLDHLYEWERICCAGNYTPALGHIVQYAYGTPRGGTFEISPDIYKQHMQRIVLCRLDGVPFPSDIEKRLVYNASGLVFCDAEGVKGKGASPREKLLRTACSVVRKYRYDTKKEEWKMGLDVSCKNRSYLFGRLLAIAERVEGRVLYAKSSTRETRALRLQRAFSQRPLSTWRTIHENLDVYFSQLSVKSRDYYRNLISEVMSMLPKEGLNLALEDVYLLGYYEQRAVLMYKAPDTEAGNETNGKEDSNEKDMVDTDENEEDNEV